MAARERKLLPGEKVEVRSLEDGFLGSWHTGVVIGYEELVRVVQYEHLLCDDNSSDKLIEQVKVSPAVDGVVNKEIKRPDEYRGLIRPSPSSCVPGTWSLHYGECVDLLHEDAWWEGVVFDHEDGCERRRIFFPDMGDEMEGRVENLRISMDWDEVTKEWKPRGNWLFLELIEEVEQDLPLLVSVKQIWYEVRIKKGFEKLGEWTSSERDLWKELILQVSSDNLKVTVKKLFAELNASFKSAEPGQSLLEFSDKTFDSVLKDGLFHSSVSVVPFEATFQSDDEGILRTDVNDKSNNQVQEQNDQVPTSGIITNVKTPLVSIPALPILSRSPDEDSGIGSNNYDESPSISLKLLRKEHNNSSMKKGLEWKLAVPELISGGEYSPDAIVECNKLYRLNKHLPRVLISKASKHLVHFGWKIQFAHKRPTEIIKRYISPEGNLYYSLRQVCKMFDHDFELGPVSQMLMSPNHDIEISVSSSEETLSPPGKSHASSELSKSCTYPDKLVIEPEHCPEAVRDYYLFSSRKKYRGLSNQEAKLKAVKAKKHLSAIGWSFHYHHKKGQGREIRYVSPTGKIFNSLVSVCKWFEQAGALTPNDLSPATGRVVNINFINDFDGDVSTNKSHLPLVGMHSPGNFPLVENDMFGNTQSSYMPMSEGFVQSIKGEVRKTRMSRKRKHDKSDCIEGSLSPKRGRKSRAPMRLRGDSNADSSTPVRRSSKRVRDRVASSSQQIPRTVLSWLIDNNVVLPREKVQYRKKNVVLKEGRITREGIKCSCCVDIFTLSKFEAHAKSTDHRPSANIFLDDGRSLLECQLQLKQRKSNQNSRLERELKGTRHNRTNDYICSVCHYGGELVLCDLCPSSFHTHCLGLKDVPDGDWFCPSCCCQICNKSISNKGNALATDSSLFICGQCERRYHGGCLKIKGDTNCYSEGYWFCHNTCQQIFYGLRRILGKKIPVGTENLTWTLVKYVETDFSKHDASDDEGFVECYSKLNVALSVMHECFEPVKEPRTRRDLMEDVIFNRWSELNRLNFKGFYTVLLEKKDELISAATVRIYGKTVAEVPLVATRFQYRRLGMCRILMNELEKKLGELGVERLVLPAIPSVLNTWITSFGFSKMSESERLNFLAYTFLDFQGTVFCQKLLNINLSVVLSPSAETQANSCDHVYNNVGIGIDGNSAVSEVFEGKQFEETGIVERESTCIKTVADNANAGCSAETAIVVHQPTLPDYSPFQSTLECSVGVATNDKQPGRNSDGLLKCYKRRRISAAC
ncbi:hypothetical protein C2S51_023531 [Perilla frutescens var. frutescens]|nr:hypothetical protein C2S51_023531 [Perilla frutescens var. frutescens]